MGDALELRVPTAGKGYRYLYRLVDDGSALRALYGMTGHTAEDVTVVINKLRAAVKPLHGEIEVLRLDAHPSHKSKHLSLYFASEQPVHGQFAPGGVHEGVGECEVTFFHDVPAANALLMAAPDLGENHMYSAMRFDPDKVDKYATLNWKLWRAINRSIMEDTLAGNSLLMTMQDVSAKWRRWRKTKAKTSAIRSSFEPSDGSLCCQRICDGKNTHKSFHDSRRSYDCCDYRRPRAT